LVRQHDVVSLHLPNFDAAGIALRGRLMKKPTTLTYHCDLKLPPGLFNRVANQVVHVMNGLAARFADAIVAYTQDFAEHSPFLTRFARKVHVVPPPVESPTVSPQAVQAFAERLKLDGHQVIGFVARLAAEKGVEVLLRALPRVLETYPQARVIFAGEYQNVLGEDAYARQLEPLLRQHAGRWDFLGILTSEELAAFYPNCDLLVLPSLNSTESFGLVQVEAMLHGTPSIASNLPGVRQPVAQTGMGQVAPIGDAQGLAEAIVEVLRNRAAYVRPRQEIAARFSTARTADGYEALFEKLLQEKGNQAQDR
jgi:glycosyltransferase involved in cell wall biosynthesis